MRTPFYKTVRPDTIKASARLEQMVPDAVLVGTAEDQSPALLLFKLLHVLEALELHSPPSGSLMGVETTIRQLTRRRPWEVEAAVVDGVDIRVPSRAEALRASGSLILLRNAVTDYYRFSYWANQLDSGTADAPKRVLRSMDAYYEDQQGPGGQRISLQLAKQLAYPMPHDGPDLSPGWLQSAEECQSLAFLAMEPPSPFDPDLAESQRTSRHLNYPPHVPVTKLGLAALDEILERGDFADWLPLRWEVYVHPRGKVADRILQLCASHPIYGTSVLWKVFIESMRDTTIERL